VPEASVPNERDLKMELGRPMRPEAVEQNSLLLADGAFTPIGAIWGNLRQYQSAFICVIAFKRTPN